MKNLRVSLGRVVAVLGVVAAASCGSSATETTASSDSAAVTTEAAAPMPLSQRVSAPLESVSGSAFEIGSLEGKDTVLWFWAPW